MFEAIGSLFLLLMFAVAGLGMFLGVIWLIVRIVRNAWRG